MRKTLLAVLALMATSFCASAQIEYQQGYFIDNNDQKTECLIKNVDWAVNPTKFKYKLNDAGEISETDINAVKEFSVANLRYLRAIVDIDQSPRDLKKLDNNRFPVWKTETVFLKALVQGKAILYHYQTREFERFFFSVDGNPVKQLIYKEYLTLSNQGSYTTYKGLQQVQINGSYMNQLEKEVSCGEKSKKPRTLKFNKTNLTAYFINYNVCNGEAPIVSDKNYRKTTVHLKITPGIDYSYLDLRENGGYNRKNAYDKKLNGRLGFEIEIVLPTNRNKWAVMVEPTYQSYIISDREVSYKSLELPIGLRHYLFLTTNTRVHINAGLVVDQPIQNSVKVSTLLVKSTTPKLNGFLGIGFDYKRFSVEGRYYSKRTGLTNDVSYFMDYRKSSVIFGYRIL